MLIPTQREPNPFEGTTVTATATFTDADDNLVDPVDPTFFVVAPDGTETTYVTADLIHVSLGVWQVKIITDQPGQWYVRPYSTQGMIAVAEGFFLTRPTRIHFSFSGLILITEDGNPITTQSNLIIVTE